MIDKTFLITGATGLIGSRIVNRLCDLGAFVKILSRDPGKADNLFKRQYTVQEFDWSSYDNPLKLRELIEDSDAIINLAGSNVAGKRWSKEYKKDIYNSRIEITKLIVNTLKICKKKPECLINASGAGYYGFCGDELLYEDSPPGNDFLARLCRDWETEAMKAVQSDVRVVTVRTGIVLDKSDGALKEFLTPFKFHFGAYQGKGDQWLSWIHIDDITELYIYVMLNLNIFGAVNGVSKEPVTNKNFTEILGKVLNKNIILPVPGFVLKLVVGEFAENLLTGQKISSQKISDAGFKFNYPMLKEALENLLVQDISK